MNKIIIVLAIISTILISGCSSSSYDAEFHKCKVIKVAESGCIRFTNALCDNRTIDYKLEKECYNEIKGYTKVGTKNNILSGCEEINVRLINGTQLKCDNDECMSEYMKMYNINRTDISNWECKVKQ
jgi:hypothetical protein